MVVRNQMRTAAYDANKEAPTVQKTRRGVEVRKKPSEEEEETSEQAAIEEIQMQLWLSDRNFSAPHIPRSRDPKDSAVHVAVREGNMEVLTWLVTKKNCSVCVFNDNGDGPLQNSAYKPLSRDIISFIHLAAAKEEATSGR